MGDGPCCSSVEMCETDMPQPPCCYPSQSCLVVVDVVWKKKATISSTEFGGYVQRSCCSLTVSPCMVTKLQVLFTYYQVELSIFFWEDNPFNCVYKNFTLAFFSYKMLPT